VVQRLARERKFLETLFNAIEDGVAVVDEQGRILYLNQAVTRLLNWVPEEVEGRPIKELLPELDWESLSAVGPDGRPRTTRHEFEVNYPLKHSPEQAIYADLSCSPRFVAYIALAHRAQFTRCPTPIRMDVPPSYSLRCKPRSRNGGSKETDPEKT
jgi:PAS domain-containing protein